MLKPSTRAFIREARQTKGYSFWDWLHGYVYGRWTYLYIGIGIGEHRLARVVYPMVSFFSKIIKPVALLRTGRQGARGDHEPGQVPRVTFADSYHGKVVPLEAAVQLVTIHEEVRITDLEKVIPYTKARDIILKNPEHILALDCPCRSARENPCLPLDVCLIIGDPFASFVEEHHAQRSRRITPEEAVDILRAEDERGHVHHAFFKDAMLGRFYAICNCCACCCGAMQAHQRGTPMLASSGYLARVDESLCIGCGSCSEVCQFDALHLHDYVALVDEQRCMGCGICVGVCMESALTLQRAPEKGEPLEILELIHRSAL